jgi:AcrR family transcriptional regulator
VVETKSRRRGAELEQAILEAAWAELSKVGYVRFTIEAVAARAGTSKPVIYRRWGSRAELVLAAWASRVPVEPGTPDTGSLRSDLLTLFNRIARRATQMMSEVIAGVAGEAFRHPEVHALFRRQLEVSPLYDAIQTIVKRAVERGELPPVTVPVRALRLPVVMVRGEAMVAGGSVPAETITELVDDVYLPLLRGLASGPATT